MKEAQHMYGYEAWQKLTKIEYGHAEKGFLIMLHVVEHA